MSLVLVKGERSTGLWCVQCSLDCSHLLLGGCWCTLQLMQDQLDKIKAPPPFLPHRGTFNAEVMASSEKKVNLSYLGSFQLHQLVWLCSLQLHLHSNSLPNFWLAGSRAESGIAKMTMAWKIHIKIHSGTSETYWGPHDDSVHYFIQSMVCISCHKILQIWHTL